MMNARKLKKEAKAKAAAAAASNKSPKPEDGRKRSTNSSSSSPGKPAALGVKSTPLLGGSPMTSERRELKKAASTAGIIPVAKQGDPEQQQASPSSRSGRATPTVPRGKSKSRNESPQ